MLKSPPEGLTTQPHFAYKFFGFGSHHGGGVDKLVKRDFEKNSRAGLIKTGGAGVPVPDIGFRGRKTFSLAVRRGLVNRLTLPGDQHQGPGQD